MPQTEARIRANKKYQQKWDFIKIRVGKGDHQRFKDHAESRGESLNAFLYRAALETIERDKKGPDYTKM